MSKTPKCYTEIVGALSGLGKKLDKKLVEEISKELDGIRGNFATPDDFKKHALTAYADALRQSAVLKHASMLRDADTVTRAVSQIKENIASKKLNAYEAVDAYIRGTSQKMGNGVNLAVDHIAHSHSARLLKGLRSTLNETKGDLMIAEKGLLSKEITQELDALQQGRAPGESGSASAARIARGYYGVLNAVAEMKAAFSPSFKKIDDYFFKATHSPDKLIAATKDKWVADAYGVYGKKSFPEGMSPEDRLKALGEIYDEITSGDYFPGGSNADIARKFTKKRTLIPESWEHFHNYNQLYGEQNIHVAITKAALNASRDVAIMQKFGTNPDKTFDELLRAVGKDLTPEQRAKLESKNSELNRSFKAMTRFNDPPSDSYFAKTLNGVANWQSLVATGNSYLRSIVDFPIAVATLADTHGSTGFFSQSLELGVEYAKFFLNRGKVLGDKEILRAMEDMGLFYKTAIYNIQSEFGGANALKPGMLSTAIGYQHIINLAHRHTKAMNAAVGTVLARRFGQLADADWATLKPQTHQGLKRYGIGELEWNLIRNHTADYSGSAGYTKTEGSLKFLNQESVHSIPDEEIAKYMKQAGLTQLSKPPAAEIARIRYNLASGLGAMFNQIGDMSTSTRGRSDSAWLNFGGGENEAITTSVRMLVQFKSSTLKSFDSLMRSARSNPKMSFDAYKVGRHVVIGSGLWILGESAIQVLSGKTPPDYTDPKLYMRAVVGSGSGGVLMDSVVSAAGHANGSSDFTEKMIKSLAGPGLSTIGDIAGIGLQGAGVLSGDPAVSGAKLLGRNIPLQNLFYTKALYNKYILDNLVEMADPNYVREKVKRDRKENSQEWWLYE